MSTWTCFTCYSDFPGTPLRCEVCMEPKCETCKHQHSRQEIRTAALRRLDLRLQQMHEWHPVRFWLLVLAIAIVLFGPIIALVGTR